jgi:hypothetical protein
LWNLYYAVKIQLSIGITIEPIETIPTDIAIKRSEVLKQQKTKKENPIRQNNKLAETFILLKINFLGILPPFLSACNSTTIHHFCQLRCKKSQKG